MAGAEGLEPSALGFGDRLKRRYTVVYGISDNFIDKSGQSFTIWIMVRTSAAWAICHSWIMS